MQSKTGTIVFVCISPLLLTLAGCGGSSTAKDLELVSLALLNDADESKRALASVEEFQASPFAKDIPEAVIAKIRSGDIVVPWNVDLNALYKVPGGINSFVIVYEKDAPTKGGYVVMGLEKAKKVTAEEFKTLKLAHTAGELDKVWNTDSEKEIVDKLTGEWELIKLSGDEPPTKGIREFSPPGMRLTFDSVSGKPSQRAWNFRVEGETIVVIPAGDGPTTTLKIKSLTDTELVIEDEEGSIEEYKKR